jgi:hypothetical protein
MKIYRKSFRPGRSFVKLIPGATQSPYLPIYNYKSEFCKIGPGSEHQRIGDFVGLNFDAAATDHYLKYIDSHADMLDQLEEAITNDSRYSRSQSYDRQLQHASAVKITTPRTA